jgi:nitrate/nitrite transporter NarK
MPYYSRIFLMTSFLIGATVMMLEMVGFRILSPHFGYDIVVWGSLIGLILACFICGYSFGGRLADRYSAITVLTAALVVSIGWFALIIASNQSVLRYLSAYGYVGMILAVVYIFGMPTLALSTSSPCITQLLSRYENLGYVAGVVYGVATMGSIVGVYYSTFFTLPTYGTNFTLQLCLVMLILSLILVRIGSKLHADNSAEAMMHTLAQH